MFRRHPLVIGLIAMFAIRNSTFQRRFGMVEPVIFDVGTARRLAMERCRIRAFTFLVRVARSDSCRRFLLFLSPRDSRSAENDGSSDSSAARHSTALNCLSASALRHGNLYACCDNLGVSA
jgi:hypothetical protein